MSGRRICTPENRLLQYKGKKDLATEYTTSNAERNAPPSLWVFEEMGDTLPSPQTTYSVSSL